MNFPFEWIAMRSLPKAGFLFCIPADITNCPVTVSQGEKEALRRGSILFQACIAAEDSNYTVQFHLGVALTLSRRRGRGVLEKLHR